MVLYDNVSVSHNIFAQANQWGEKWACAKALLSSLIHTCADEQIWEILKFKNQIMVVAVHIF